MFSPMMSSPWCLLPAIMANSTPVFSRCQLSCVVFEITFFILKRVHEKPARTCIIFFPSLSSEHLNALVRLMYHQKSFSYGLIRPYLGRCEILRRLKLFPKKRESLAAPF